MKPKCQVAGCERTQGLTIEKRTGAILCPLCAIKSAQREAFLKGIMVGLEARVKR